MMIALLLLNVGILISLKEERKPSVNGARGYHKDDLR